MFPGTDRDVRLCFVLTHNRHMILYLLHMYTLWHSKSRSSRLKHWIYFDWCIYSCLIILGWLPLRVIFWDIASGKLLIQESANDFVGACRCWQDNTSASCNRLAVYAPHAFCHSHSCFVIFVDQKWYVPCAGLRVAWDSDHRRSRAHRANQSISTCTKFLGDRQRNLICTLFFFVGLCLPACFGEADATRRIWKQGPKEEANSLSHSCCRPWGIYMHQKYIVLEDSVWKCALHSYMLSSVTMMTCLHAIYASWVTFRNKECLGAAAKFLFGTTGMAIGVSWRFWFAITRSVCLCTSTLMSTSQGDLFVYCTTHCKLRQQITSFDLLSSWPQNRFKHIQRLLNF